jgi:hypothetical protein
VLKKIAEYSMRLVDAISTPTAKEVDDLAANVALHSEILRIHVRQIDLLNKVTAVLERRK